MKKLTFHKVVHFLNYLVVVSSTHWNAIASVQLIFYDNDLSNQKQKCFRLEKIFLNDSIAISTIFALTNMAVHQSNIE